jgi:signal recognition particle subunit SRP54
MAAIPGLLPAFGRKNCASTLAGVFDTLSDRLKGALGDLRKGRRLDDETISKAMREIRLALLEADVNFQVVKDFVGRVRERAASEEVLKSLTPGQQVVKIVHEELTALMGSGDSRLAFAGRQPTVILLAGLQGSGKTTAAAKLALLLRKEGKQPALVAADLQRPAAIDQLEQLGLQIQIPVYSAERSDPVKATREGIASAEGDVVIVDTAGRLHVDEALMEELAAVRREAKPTNVLLVLDAMTGQEAVAVAQAFQERVDFDGVVLTKLDGDARGGAALSVKAVTGKPIKLVSVGEKVDQLEYFHPDRMASRILGMGDVLSLIEKAEAAVEEDEREQLEQRLMKGEFSFDDFLSSYKMLRRMGPLQGVMKLIPGLGKQLEGLDQVDENQLTRVEGIILSMTPRERALPHLIDSSRRLRIARGSGTDVQQVNQLLEARKQMAKVMKQMRDGKMPSLPGLEAAGNPNGARAATARKTKSKRRKKKKARR